MGPAHRSRSKKQGDETLGRDNAADFSFIP
jgi:hypothetical protein